MNLTRVTLATASSVLLLATLAACGGDSSADSATDGGDQAAGQGQMEGQGGGMPGASGLVAAVSGSTAQVHSQQSGQVAVSWTGKTSFTQQVDAKLSDVTVGACVMVTSDDTSGSEDSAATEVAATGVRILPAGDDGSCDFGAGQGGPGGAGGPGGGEMPEGAPSDMPSDMPSDLPSDRPSDLPQGGGFGTVGEVTEVSSSGFTVSSSMPTMGQDDSDSSGSATTTEVEVSVSGDTTYTTSADATASAVKVGVCVSAQGESDDTGAVTADTVSISQAVDGECTGGFGGGGRPGSAE